MSSRARRLKSSGTVDGVDYVMSNSSEAQALRAVAASSGGGAATGYPNATRKHPVWITPGQTLENGDLIYVTEKNITPGEGEYGYDLLDATESLDFNGDEYYRIYQGVRDAATDGLTLGTMMIVGIYNGPTIVGPDDPSWEGHPTDEFVVVDIIMSGEAEFVCANKYYGYSGSGISCTSNASASASARTKLYADREAAALQLPGWFIQDTNGGADLQTCQVPPGYVTPESLPDKSTITAMYTTNGITVPSGF